VLLPSVRVRGVVAVLDPRTLAVSGDVAGLASEFLSVLLVPDAGVRRAPPAAGAAAPAGRRSVRAAPWTRSPVSLERARRAGELVRSRREVVDTDEHLAALVLSADPEALADLRARVLAPLADLPEATAERLAETLRAWLLHQGRREQVAAVLHVHPQTVRYRMTQLRELYGERLQDPEAVLELTVALAQPVAPEPG
jgi:sugar diacid utilization regulator